MRRRRRTRRTRLQEQYFDEVIRLHFEEGLGEDRISHIIPVGHTTVWRWIHIYADQNKQKLKENENNDKE